ncbi:MAG TPA: FAD-dependent oxidoreductase, partial [Pseudomonadales bacterium]|nr:FAD-dependent oxidoreductase [Pseudomonadales bacterium]
DYRFQDVVYHDKHNDDIKAMISSVLAGYAWDENNPYVKDSERRMNVLAEICRST